MESWYIRSAVESDWQTLLEFEQEIVNAERAFDDTLKEGVIHYYDLREKITSTDSELAVAVAGDAIIGSGFATIKKASDYLKYETYAHLRFMYVKPDFRGQGVNAAILDWLKNWALTRGVHELFLEVYEENIRARKAYEKAGFRPLMLEMRLSV